jgi:hypothetical protein
LRNLFYNGLCAITHTLDVSIVIGGEALRFVEGTGSVLNQGNHIPYPDPSDNKLRVAEWLM